MSGNVMTNVVVEFQCCCCQQRTSDLLDYLSGLVDLSRG